MFHRRTLWMFLLLIPAWLISCTANVQIDETTADDDSSTSDDSPDSASQTPTYSIGGTVSGLVSGTLKLLNNDENLASITANGSYLFSQELEEGEEYTVTVHSQPADYECTVSNGTGTVTSEDITNVNVNCVSTITSTYSVGGTVSGLVLGTLELLNNGSHFIEITMDGSYAFTQELESGEDYDVSIQTSPEGYLCEISNESGTISGADITNVDISCSLIPTYSVGGSVSGLVSGTLELLNNGGDQLDLTSDGDFTFSEELEDLEAYNVTIQSNPSGYTCEITNGSGTISGTNITDIDIECTEDVAVNACTSSPFVGWDDPSALNDIISLGTAEEHEAGGPHVAMDNNCNAIIVWQQFDGSNMQIFKAEYRSGAWTYPSSLSNSPASPAGEDAYSPRVAMDDDGNAIITWVGFDGSNTQIFKAEYRSGAWTYPSSVSDNISPNGQDAYDPDVTMDNNGNAIITWYQSTSTNTQIFKSEYRSGSWTNPSSLTDNISPDGKDAAIPRVAMDNNGNAIIVWVQQNSSNNYQIYKSEYRSGSWVNPSGLSDSPTSPDSRDVDVAFPGLAMDNNGNAIITWSQNDGTRRQVYKAEYRSGSWAYPSSLANDHINIDTQNTYSPLVAMDDNNNAIITWTQSNGTNFQTFKSEYRSGSWTNPSTLSDNISPDGYDVSIASSFVAASNSGTAVITWDQMDGSNPQIFRSHYVDGSWNNPALITNNISPSSQEAFYAPVAMDDIGQAIIVWIGWDGTTYQIYKSEYR